MTEVGDLPLDAPATPDVHAITTGIDLDSVTLNPDPVTTAIGVAAAMTLIEVIPDHSTDLPIETSHMTEAPVPTTTIVIHPTTDPHLTGTLPEMSSRSQHRSRKHHYKPDQGSSSTSQAPSWKHKDRRHKQVKIDNPPSEYYSSDNNDSNSNEDLN